MDAVGTIEEADRQVADAVEPVRHSPAVRALGWLSEVADQPQLISICAGTLAVGLFLGDRRLARTGAKMLAAELLATKLKSMVKHRIDRTRPRVVHDGEPYRMRKGGSRETELSSFPSGHTAGAVAVARIVAGEYPGHRAAAYGAAGAVAAIQVPRCQHYPSDIAAGAVVGLAAAAAVEMVAALSEKAFDASADD